MTDLNINWCRKHIKGFQHWRTVKPVWHILADRYRDLNNEVERELVGYCVKRKVDFSV